MATVEHRETALGQAQAELVGRAEELRVLGRLLGTPGGGAILVVGDPGMGKTALLEVAGAQARQKGWLVLETRAVESEAKIQFAGLHQLLAPALEQTPPGDQSARRALAEAFSSTAGIPNLLPIALAALAVLGESARRRPTLVLADDAHWLDEASTDVLAFVARRIRREAIALVVACRTDSVTPLHRADLTLLPLRGVDDAAALDIVRNAAPDLPGLRCQQVLEEAGGNPLALREMALLQSSSHRPLPGAFASDHLPLSDRLERGYAGRFRELPSTTRAALVIAALNDDTSLIENLAAMSHFDVPRPTLRDLEPAEEVGLIETTEREIKFAHPLVRSAIRQAAGTAIRQAAHAALAEVLADQPDRSVWHRAAGALGPDETVAAALEATADRAERRKGPAVALRALRRAAELSERPACRGRRLIDAACLAWMLGHRDLMADLLVAAEGCELSRVDRARALWAREAISDAQGKTPVATIVTLVHRLLDDVVDPTSDERESAIAAPGRTAQSLIAGSYHARRPQEVSIDLLLVAAYKAYWHDHLSVDRDSVLEAAARVPIDAYNGGQVMLIDALLDPLARGSRVIDRASRLSIGTEINPAILRLVGMALAAIPDFIAARPWLTAAADGLRAQAGSALLARTLSSSTAGAAALGYWHEAGSDAAEGYALALETDQPRWAAKLAGTLARVGGARGDVEQATFWLAKAQAALATAGTRSVFAELLLGRAQVAHASGRHDECFDYLVRLFDPSDPACLPRVGACALLDLAEAALLSGGSGQASMIITTVNGWAARTRSRYLRVCAGQALAILQADPDPELAFRAALSDSDASDFGRARVNLAYGSWLRRRRRIAEARGPLRSARDTFVAFDTPAWRERAVQELRASGESRRPSGPDGRDALTPQELEIIELAAQGLSNRDIGQRLFLSHRTIGSHLYRIFPKLGISSRRQLGGVWTSLAPDREYSPPEA